MAVVTRQVLAALAREIRLATLSLKLDVLLAGLERRYRPDQPRAPKGTAEGGQWIDDLSRLLPPAPSPDRIQVAGPRCDGFSSGCQNGGSFGTTGMFRLLGKNLCFDCAVKFFSIEDLSGSEQMEYLARLGKLYRQGRNDVVKSGRPQCSEGR